MKHAPPVLVRGCGKLEHNRLLFTHIAEGAPYPELILTLSDKTWRLDAVTGKAAALSGHSEMLCAYVGPAMSRSLPPVAAAHVVLCRPPADGPVPVLAEIQRIHSGKDGSLTAETDREIVFHLSRDTLILAAPGTGRPPTLESLKPGTRVLAWYQVVTLSLPPQAAPTQLVVFP